MERKFLMWKTHKAQALLDHPTYVMLLTEDCWTTWTTENFVKGSLVNQNAAKG